jgi:hypothetical protein
LISRLGIVSPPGIRPTSQVPQDNHNIALKTIGRYLDALAKVDSAPLVVEFTVEPDARVVMV